MDAANFLFPPARSRRPARLARTVDRLGRVAAWLGACLERSRQRRALADLDDRLLKDIGLSRAEVARERGRWPWDGARIVIGGGRSTRAIRRPSAR